MWTRLGNLHVTVLDCDVVPPASALNASFAPLLPVLASTPIASRLLSGSVWNASSPLGGGRLLRYQAASCQGGGGGAGAGCGPLEAECVAALAEEVRQGGPWAVIYFPANFTASYLSWFAGSGISPPEQRPTGVYYYARGRDYSTYSYVNAIVLNSLVPAVSRSLTLGLAANSAAMKLLSPVFLATGVALREVDLAPVRNFGQHFATYIFCVLLWLGSSFVVATSYQFKLPAEVAILVPRVSKDKGKDEEEDGEARGQRTPREQMRQLAWALWVKGAVAAVFMFIEMILLCAVLWALGKGSEAWYRNAGQTIAFGWYLSWSFIAVNGVLLHAMGPDRFSSASALLLIVQLTSSSGIMSVDLSNRFFYIGKGLPFFYGVRGFRALFFGVMTDAMYQNWLVLTAYNVVLAPLGVWLVSRRIWKLSEQAAARPGGAAAYGSIALPVAGGAV
ncbi:hypothetical protein GPECTOR_67g325 [Gonium pectorale]|uniref:DUF3533 domain-containing protein n=1 Tax=Gonium pectorale TaxID=33097 RepID=A0A150G4N0_GONPE|nr:hypothetical protein GPECTOR_67g325 [Gonium pectorale]|eukprot:KXZ44485.1 hypothetical protein GPECTOR_67g325 [Gonium pectorale]